MSAAIGAALAGARTITATSSQGLALMAEVVYIAAAMRAPIVMAVGNRALSGPINIHCDHSDSMLVRDSGRRPALRRERAGGVRPDGDGAAARRAPGRAAAGARVPGRLHDHALRRAGRAARGRRVKTFVGDYHIPFPLLDIERPTTQGPFAMPDYYFELRHQQGAAMQAALAVFEAIAAEFYTLSGRRYHSVEPYALDGADHAIVCLGSTGGTVKDVVDELRGEGEAVGLLEMRSFRPFPVDRVRAALEPVAQVAVLDRADSPGGAPPLFAELAAVLYGTDVELRSYVYGLGGRDIHPEDIRELFAARGPAYVGLRGAPCPA